MLSPNPSAFAFLLLLPISYIEFAQVKKIVKNLSVVVTTNEFQNSCIFSFKILCSGNMKGSKMRGSP